MSELRAEAGSRLARESKRIVAREQIKDADGPGHSILWGLNSFTEADRWNFASRVERFDDLGRLAFSLHGENATGVRNVLSWCTK